MTTIVWRKIMKFETAEDRATERRVFDYMERCWNCNIIQLPEYSAIDGMIYNHDNTFCKRERKLILQFKNTTWCFYSPLKYYLCCYSVPAA